MQHGDSPPLGSRGSPNAGSNGRRKVMLPLRDIVARLKEDKRQLRQINQELRDRITELEPELERETTSGGHLRDHVRRLETENEEIAARLERALQQEDDMKVSFEQEREQMQTAMQEMKGLISDLRANWQTTIQDAQSKADGLNDEKTVLMTYAKDLEARWKQAAALSLFTSVNRMLERSTAVSIHNAFQQWRQEAVSSSRAQQQEALRREQAVVDETQRALETANVKLTHVNSLLESTKKDAAAELADVTERSTATIEKLRADLKADAEEHARIVSDMKKAHQAAEDAAAQQHTQAIRSLKADYENRLQEQEERYESQIQDLRLIGEAEAQAAHDKHQKQVDHLTTESAAKLHAVRSSLEQRLSDEAEKHHDTIAAMRAQHDDELSVLHEQASTKYASAVSRLERELEDQRTKLMDELKETRASAEAAYEELEKTSKAKLAAEQEQHSAAMAAKAEQHATAIKKQRDELTAELEAVRTRLSNEVEELQKELNVAVARERQRTADESNALQERYEARLRTQEATYQEQITSLRRAHTEELQSAVQTAQQKLEADVAALESQLKHSKETVSKSDDQIMELKSSLADTQLQLKSAKAELAHRVEVLETALADTEAKLHSERSRLTDELDTAKRSLSDAKAVVASQEELLERLRNEAQARQSALEEAKTAEVDAKDAADAAERERSRVVADVALYRGRAEDLQQRLDQVEDSLMEKDAALAQMQVERMGHVSQLKDLNSDTSRHQGMLHRLTEERNAERARAQELEMKLRQMAADASVQAQLAQLTAWRTQLDREKQLLGDRERALERSVKDRALMSSRSALHNGSDTSPRTANLSDPAAWSHGSLAHRRVDDAGVYSPSNSGRSWLSRSGGGLSSSVLDSAMKPAELRGGRDSAAATNLDASGQYDGMKDASDADPQEKLSLSGSHRQECRLKHSPRNQRSAHDATHEQLSDDIDRSNDDIDEVLRQSREAYSRIQAQLASLDVQEEGSAAPVESTEDGSGE